MSFSFPILKPAARPLLMVAMSVLLFGCSQAPDRKTADTTTIETTSTSVETNSKAGSANSTSEQPGLAGEKTDSKELSAKVLMRPDFIGRVKMCYMAAKEIPALSQKLFCYCGCDYTDEHSSLLDCYTSDHSVDCEYCQGEMMMAFKMNRKGASVAEIQKALDLNWAPHYPFYEQPSDAIKKYWKTRIWAPGARPTKFENPNETKPIDDPFTGSKNTTSKPMGKKSDCCGKKHDKEAK